MSFDMSLSFAALILYFVSMALTHIGIRRLPRKIERSKLSETLQNEHRLLALSASVLPAAIVCSLLFHGAFVVAHQKIGVTGDWSVAWKILSVSSCVILVFAVAFYEAVRSFNNMRK